MRPRLIKLVPVAACLLVSTLALCDEPGNKRLDEQRAAFRAVRADVERGNWQAVRPFQALLEDYVLWPDLRAAYLKARIQNSDANEIKAFLDEYGVLKPARELRYRYAMQLAKDGQLADYLTVYQQFYQGLEVANLDCLALQAEIADGRLQRVVTRALELWNVGKNQVDECDAVFDDLRQKNLLTQEDYVSRFVLAIDAKQFSLARYLARSLDARYLNEANEWLRAQNNPSTLIREYLDYADTNLSKQLFAYAIERIAYDDPAEASKHWRTLSRHFSYSDDQIQKNQRHIALWAARTRLPQADEMLAALPPTARDTEVRRWIVRQHLLRRRWADIKESAQAFSEEEKNKEEWRYWYAISLAQTVSSNQEDESQQILAELANERSYYGFLAADLLNQPYALSEAPLVSDSVVANRLASTPGIVRARELYFVGLESKGRSEWDAEMRLLTAKEQIQAALLADSWGWHSRAIATIAKAGEYDDLHIRYPLPWRQDFETQAGTAGIRSSWAYGVARSESLFMRDIRSSAGAVGLMQLMPATGRQTAKEISLPWSGIATLTDSANNIRLGTHYLGKMFARFNDNRILATAAYNAGPGRVDAWLPSNEKLDARVWIENIPFNETRAYVRRVLTDDVIFHWRMTGQQRRLSAELPAVVAVPATVVPGRSD